MYYLLKNKNLKSYITPPQMSNNRRSSSCRRQTSKKYTDRPSPAFPANKCCGERKLGKDNLMWISVRASNGICRWQHVKRRSPRRCSTRRRSPRRRTH